MLISSLDGDFTPKFGVPCTPHFTHAAFADGGVDRVMAELGASFHGQWLVRSRLRSLGAVYKTYGLGVHEISVGVNGI